MLEHKTSFNKFKTVTTSSILSDHNGKKLEINHKKKSKKYTKALRLNNMLQDYEWANNEIKKEIKRYLETNENENAQICGTQGKQA